MSNFPEKCQEVDYIDCRGWYDLVAQLVILGVATIILYKVILTYRNLNNDLENDNQSEIQKSIRRKLVLSIVQLFYLVSFITSIIYQICVFIPFSLTGQAAYVADNLTNPSKILQNIFINALNSLNLTVGLLYWKATRGYYVLSQLPVPIIYRTSVNLNLAAIISSIIWLQTSYITTNSIEYFTLISTSISIICCLGCRINYRIKILKMVRLSQKAIIKQKFSSVLLFIAGILRIILYAFQVQKPDWPKFLRNYSQPQSINCLDQSPYYAFCIVSLHLLINLLPSAIYCYLFKAQNSNFSTKNQPILNDTSNSSIH